MTARDWTPIERLRCALGGETWHPTHDLDADTHVAIKVGIAEIERLGREGGSRARYRRAVEDAIDLWKPETSGRWRDQHYWCFSWRFEGPAELTRVEKYRSGPRTLYLFCDYKDCLGRRHERVDGARVRRWIAKAHRKACEIRARLGGETLGRYAVNPLRRRI